MERELTILVIEDDEHVCKCFENYAQTMEKLSIVACTDDSNKAIELLREYLPDVIILDLELDKGRGNGIDFLNVLKKTELPYKPFVIVTTNNSSEMTKEIVRSMGADFYFSKHQSDYSELGILKFLESMKEQIQNVFKKSNDSYYLEDSEDKKEKHIRILIEKELELIGITANATGYKYLVDAIYLVINGEERVLARVIGEKYHKSPQSVVKAMQHLIDRAWNKNREENLEYYTARINPQRGAPTVTELIYYYANKIDKY